MRKFGAFGLAVFYLLLMTGMFVCLVHCSAEYLFGTPGHELVVHEDDDDHDHEAIPSAGRHEKHENEKAHGHKKACNGKNCSCCNRHDNYLIKENIPGSPDFLLTAMQVAVFPLPYQALTPVPGVYEAKISWPNATGPPHTSNQLLFIKYRSLLI